MVASIMFDRLPPSRESQSNKMGAISTEVETCERTIRRITRGLLQTCQQIIPNAAHSGASNHTSASTQPL